MDMRRREPNLTRGALREVARLRRVEMERTADRVRLDAEHDIELLERVEALRTRGVVRYPRALHHHSDPTRRAA